MRTLLSATCLASIVLLSGCGHYIAVDVTQPARKTLPNVRALAVTPVDAGKIGEPAASAGAAIGTTISTSIAQKITSENFIKATVVGPVTGASDKDLAAAVSSDYQGLWVGEFTTLSVGDSAPEPVQQLVPMQNPTTGQTELVTVDYTKITRRASAQVSYRVLRVPEGRVLAGDSAAHSVEKSVVAETPDLAQAQLPTAQSLLVELVGPIAEQLATDISPKKVKEERRLLGGDEAVDRGVEFMMNAARTRSESAIAQAWDQAQLEWEEASEKAENPSDRAAAFYNLSVYYEVRNDWDNATKCIDEARKIEPDNDLFIEFTAKLDQRRAQYDLLNQQKDALSGSGTP